jgi:hypothetical protein
MLESIISRVRMLGDNKVEIRRIFSAKRLDYHRSTSFEASMIRKRHLIAFLLISSCVDRLALCKTDFRHGRDKSPSVYRLLQPLNIHELGSDLLFIVTGQEDDRDA